MHVHQVHVHQRYNKSYVCNSSLIGKEKFFFAGMEIRPYVKCQFYYWDVEAYIHGSYGQICHTTT